MTQAMTEAQRVEFLASLGMTDKAKTTTKVSDVPLAPEGVDPRTMPVTDIVFDERLLDGFDLDTQLREVADHVFAFYKSPTKNKDRNSLLWREVGLFIQRVKRERATGGFVKEKVKTTKTDRDLAAVIAKAGITPAELIALIEERA